MIIISNNRQTMQLIDTRKIQTQMTKYYKEEGRSKYNIGLMLW